MKRLSVLLIVIASIMWATSGIFIKSLTSQGFNENEITLAKIALSIIIIFGVSKIQKEKIGRIKTVPDFALFAVSGAIGYLMYGLAYAKSVKYIPISAAVVLVYTAPVIVMLSSIVLFKEKLTRRKVICVVLIVIGCVFVEGILSENLSNISGVGIIYGICSGVCYAFYTVSNKFLLKKYSVYTVSLYNFLFAFIAIFLMTDKSGIINKVIQSGASGAVPLVLFSILCGGVPHMLYVKSLDYLEAGKASLITIIEPVAAALLGIVVFKEGVTFIKICGFIMIVAALVLLNIKSKSDATD